ncbi:BRCA1-associated ATM activator 1 isoform X1 [Pezoporus wallicus]|uniref:BRCA1-associated ATM activator 1 isoform X1 n=1 Tax=Pezoporus wallicus TaxID=35540 RepID=UPI00254E451E|nr:BRCA1-associated ATM activator 1 isoform X1 [Pezoporus wallicus]
MFSPESRSLLPAMTRECSVLLPRVCAALAHPRQPRYDDTCLEKLLDWFRSLTAVDPSVELVQDNPCLMEFIASVLALPKPSPSILSFTLRLAGILAASESRFQHLQQEKLLVRLFGRDGPLSSAVWEDASVRSGWVNGVHSMMQHQPALHFLCEGGGIDVVFTLQGDPSLFVASAASQLLVHMLTLSVESETTIPLTTKDCDWPACAQMIIKHIEDSLQSSSASHIEQSLKLLTSLFGSCHALWTEVLWLRIAKQIESFLMEETLQVQHMLANLLLKMSRSPVFDTEGSFWALVTSALEHLTPVQAGPLAVRILRLYKCPQDVRIQALTVLLQPMDCILRAASQPLEYAGLLDESVSDPITIESLLSSKSTCASLLCQTLAHLKELLSLVDLPIDLPSTPLLRSLMTILQFCNGFLSPASTLGSTVSRILINSFRVQRSALDVLAALSEQKGCDTLIGSVFDVLLAYLESPNTSPTVLKTTFQATSKWLVRLQEVSCSNSQWQQAEKILEDVFLVLQKRLCSPCWEVRDSSLEFLTVLIKCLTDQDEFRQSLLSSEVPRLTENLLEDSESYVRASAVTAVGHLAFITYFAPESPVVENQCNKEKTIGKLQEILSTDPEGFPRRAVISIFIEWVRQGCTGQLEDTEQFVSRVIQTVEHDLDWEVRLGGLELVDIFCHHAFCHFGLPKCPYAPVSSAVTSSIHQNEVLQILCRANLFSFLFRSLCDCDQPVGQRACDLLLNLRINFYPTFTPRDSRETEDSPVGRSIAWLQRTLRQGSLAKNFPTDGGNGVDFQDPESMMIALGTIDLEELRDELNKSSDHVEKSPQSLLQDILATVGTIEENEADCY